MKRKTSCNLSGSVFVSSKTFKEVRMALCATETRDFSDIICEFLHDACNENCVVDTNKVFQFNDKIKSKTWSKFVTWASHITA